MNTDLERFYEVVANDPALNKQFESITDQENFLQLAVRLGSQKNYTFTTSQVESSIQSSTTSGQGEYFCLPIGCWTKAKSA